MLGELLSVSTRIFELRPNFQKHSRNSHFNYKQGYVVASTTVRGQTTSKPKMKEELFRHPPGINHPSAMGKITKIAHEMVMKWTLIFSSSRRKKTQKKQRNKELPMQSHLQKLHKCKHLQNKVSCCLQQPVSCSLPTEGFGRFPFTI